MKKANRLQQGWYKIGFLNSFMYEPRFNLKICWVLMECILPNLFNPWLVKDHTLNICTQQTSKFINVFKTVYWMVPVYILIVLKFIVDKNKNNNKIL